LAKTLAGDLGGALADLDACCHAFPQEPEFLTRRALVLLALARTAEAREMMERAHAIHPGWAEFVRRLAETHIVPMAPAPLVSLVAGLT
jgi:predicted Zn-dependent protease